MMKSSTCATSKIPRPIKDYVIIEVDRGIFKTETGFKGIDGKEIHLDPSYDPQRHARISGKVVAVPDKLSRFPIAQVTAGMPAYYSSSTFRYKRRCDIAMEVKVGDTVYFHFNTLAAMNGKKNRVGENLYKVAYESIICSVRDGEIIMIGGYTLIKPDVETWDDILIPVPVLGSNGEPMKDRNGNIIYKPKDKWLQTKAAPENKYLQGYVVKVGTPLKGDTCRIKPGQKIWYHKNADWLQYIEGKQYFTIRQNHIIAALNE